MSDRLLLLCPENFLAFYVSLALFVPRAYAQTFRRAQTPGCQTPSSSVASFLISIRSRRFKLSDEILCLATKALMRSKQNTCNQCRTVVTMTFKIKRVTGDLHIQILEPGSFYSFYSRHCWKDPEPRPIHTIGDETLKRFLVRLPSDHNTNADAYMSPPRTTRSTIP